MKHLIILGLFFFLSLPLYGAETPLDLGNVKLEQVTKEGLSQVPYQLNNSKKKKLVLFWATWCSTCKHKLTDILPPLNNRSDVEVLAVNIDDEAQLGRVRHYIEKNKIQLNIFKNTDGLLIKNLNVTTAPHWAIYILNEKSKKFELIHQEVAFDEAKINSFLK